MKPLNMPTEPIDGYEVRLWRIFDSDWTVQEWTAVYSEKTSHWVIKYPDGSFHSRIAGWDWKQEHWAPFFKTQADAAVAACEHIRENILRKRALLLKDAEALARLDPVASTLVESGVRTLYEDIFKQWRGYDINAGWNVQKDSDEGRAAATALDIVLFELQQKAGGL